LTNHQSRRKNIKTKQSKVSKLTSIKTKSKENKKATATNKGVTLEERVSLAQDIKQLPSEHYYGLWEIVKKADEQNSSSEIEIDLETLQPKILKALQKYVKSKLKAADKLKLSKKREKIQTTPRVELISTQENSVVSPQKTSSVYHFPMDIVPEVEYPLPENISVHYPLPEEIMAKESKIDQPLFSNNGPPLNQVQNNANNADTTESSFISDSSDDD